MEKDKELHREEERKITGDPHISDSECQIVWDLLPSYVEGECSEASKEMVAKHISTCPDCAERLRKMKTNLESVLPEVKEQDKIKIDAMRKVKRKHRKNVVLAVIAAALIACFAMQVYFRVHIAGDMGASAENRAAREKAEEMMETLQTEGADAFVEQMNPVVLYEDLCTPRKNRFAQTDAFVSQTMGDDAVTEMKITLEDGSEEHNYWITDQSIVYNLKNAEETQKPANMEEKVYLDTQDTNAYVHSLMAGNHTNYILSEQQYHYLISEYGEVDDSWVEKMEIEGEIYYCRSDIGKTRSESGDREAEDSPEKNEAVMAYLEEFTEDMYRIVPEIRQPDPTYIYIATSSIVPEELLWVEEKYLDTIDGWYEQYAAHYRELGYEKFEEIWKENLKQELYQMEESLGTVEEVRLQTQPAFVFRIKAVWPDSRWNGEENTSGGWYMIWDVQYSNGTCEFFLNVDDNGQQGYLYRYGVTYNEWKNFNMRDL